MIRFVFIALAVVASIYLMLRIVREVESANVDWRGVAFAIGFVAVAIYLRHATEIGGLG